MFKDTNERITRVSVSWCCGCEAVTVTLKVIDVTNGNAVSELTVFSDKSVH